MKSVLLLAVVSIAGAGVSAAQDGGPVRPLFTDAATLTLTIEGPLRRLQRERRRRPDLEGVVRYQDAAGDEVVLGVELTARGNSRLDLCSFPPLWLNFRRGQLEGTVFAGQNRIKLVSLCRRDDSHRDYLAQEYQVYRAFNALTDKSFRVRWVSVEYVDTEAARGRSYVEPAFFIEEDWEVAERNGMEVVKVTGLEPAQLDPRETTLLSLFQFLIGNTDYSPRAGPGEEACCHNTKLIGYAGRDMDRVALPYDFDQTGLVGAGYAEPPPSLRLSNVRERLYRGYCLLNEEVAWAVIHLQDRRERVRGAFDVDMARERARARALEYLESGYEILGDPVRRQEEILDRCLG